MNAHRAVSRRFWRRPRFVLLLAGLIAVGACRHTASEDTNLLIGRCSTRVRTKGPAPQLPQAPSLRMGFGGVIGTLADAGGALPHYPIMAVTPGDNPSSAHASATPDSVGGFTFASLAPGRYRLFVHAYGHRPDSTDVAISAGRVDTVSFVLQYFGCVK